jgi:phosphoribosylglycinamide formyltransferase-1
MSAKIRVGILISGRGSNMRALVEACKAPEYPAEVVCVISNRPKAAGLDWARAEKLPAYCVDHKKYNTREEFEQKLNEILQAAGVELICNAGFMRILTASFVEKWYNRQLNIHPSLLPAFKGLHTHERVLAAGVMTTGCTVHVVRTEMDSGPIIAQAEVDVRPCDTPETLAARVLVEEHRIYPKALALVASGKIKLPDNT